ncbi:MAG: Rrf2 family transcriptional regulator [Corynebacterium sp.]|nr:Rrf2 family transcriptional regulator [Corynebacterium sp.]
MVDTKFSMALHVLSMISEERNTLSSADIARSVGTNASYIRRLLSTLKSNGIITSQQGKSGYTLAKSPAELSLFEIYCATQDTSGVTVFHVHQHPNLECPVGKNIENAINPLFADAVAQLEASLKDHSLQDVIDGLYLSAGVCN